MLREQTGAWFRKLWMCGKFIIYYYYYEVFVVLAMCSLVNNLYSTKMYIQPGWLFGIGNNAIGSTEY